MGWQEDFEKALQGLVDFLEEMDIPFEIIGEDDIDDEPEVGIFHKDGEEVEDSYYAPVADFFENLEKGTDEEVSNFVGELLGRPEEEDDDEEWFEYFAHLGFGYWDGERREAEERTFFSTSQNKKDEIRDIMENDYGRRDLYMGYGIGGPVVVDVTDPYPVDKSEVDENEII